MASNNKIEVVFIVQKRWQILKSGMKGERTQEYKKEAKCLILDWMGLLISRSDLFHKFIL